MSWNEKFGGTKKQDKSPDQWIWMVYIIEKELEVTWENTIKTVALNVNIGSCPP